MKMLGKIIGGALLLTMMASPSWADGGNAGGKNTVSWATIIGIIQAGNMVGGIPGGGQPWSTLGGRASVNLTNSLVVFSVKGLVLAGGNTIGTPGAINQVEGTLVCNAGTASPAIFDTPAITLDPQGNASFKGSFTMPTDGCSTSAVAFLIRIPANGHWIANGSVQVPYP